MLSIHHRVHNLHLLQIRHHSPRETQRRRQMMKSPRQWTRNLSQCHHHRLQSQKMACHRHSPVNRYYLHSCLNHFMAMERVNPAPQLPDRLVLE